MPLFVRFPAAVRELVSLTVREPPELTVKFPWAKMPEVTSTKAKSVTIFFIIFCFNIFLKGVCETASLNYSPILIFLIGVRETASLNYSPILIFLKGARETASLN